MHMMEAKEQLQRIIGNNIKLSRIAQGYTQEVLAERAEVSVVTDGPFCRKTDGLFCRS